MKVSIWTIGHSTRSIGEFIDILKAYEISILADIRSFPGSRRVPQFNMENLMKLLPEQNIEYMHIKELGGRRKGRLDSDNIAWKNLSFRNYADYMETEEFEYGLSLLTQAAEVNNTAFMCAEALWWRCHRSMVADILKLDGWKVIHIMDKHTFREHPYTSAASIVEGKLSYKILK